MAKPPRKARPTRPGRLRIVAGKWRRRLLPVADAEGLRPTAERVRETLFNWLAPCIEGARCIDLCAGTGALGFEALSRGARHAVLVERSAPVARVLEQAAAMLGAGADIVQADARDWLASAPVEPADVVFVDPPYRDALQGELCRLLATRGWLAPGARIYVELGKGEPLPPLPDHWTVLRDRAAGNVRYLLLDAGA